MPAHSASGSPGADPLPFGARGRRFIASLGPRARRRRLSDQALLAARAGAHAWRVRPSDDATRTRERQAGAGRPQAGATRGVLSHDGIEIDFERHEVRFDGARVELTPPSSASSAALLERPGVVLSRAQLMRARPRDGTVITERTTRHARSAHSAEVRRARARPDHHGARRGVQGFRRVKSAAGRASDRSRAFGRILGPPLAGQRGRASSCRCSVSSSRGSTSGSCSTRLERDMNDQAGALACALLENDTAKGVALDDARHGAILRSGGEKDADPVRILGLDGAALADSHGRAPPKGPEPRPPRLFRRGAAVRRARLRSYAESGSRSTTQWPPISQRRKVRAALAGRTRPRRRASPTETQAVFLFTAIRFSAIGPKRRPRTIPGRVHDALHQPGVVRALPDSLGPHSRVCL